MSTFTKLIASAATGFAAVAAIVSVTPAFAAPAQHRETKTVMVDYSAIDLSTPAGEDKLRGKVRRAARVACSYSLAASDPETVLDQKRCMREALSLADPQVAAAVRSVGPHDTRFASTSQHKIAAR